MDDQPIGSEEKPRRHEQRDDPLPSMVASSNCPNGHDGEKQQDCAWNQIKHCFHWVWMICVWIFRHILSNRDFWMAVATVVIAVSTIVYTRYAGKQWETMNNTLEQIKQQTGAMQKQVTEMQKQTAILNTQLQEEERPYIVLEKNNADRDSNITALSNTDPYPPTKGKPIEVNLHFRNIGKSPALNVVVHRHVLMGNSIKKFRNIEPPDKHSDSILMANEPMWVTAVSVKNTWAIENINIPSKDFVAWDGKQEFIVFGRVTYDDRYGNKYCTSFAKTPLFEGGAWVTVNVSLCPTGYRP